jgi:hypothetical protein
VTVALRGVAVEPFELFRVCERDPSDEQATERLDSPAAAKIIAMTTNWYCAA